MTVYEAKVEGHTHNTLLFMSRLLHTQIAGEMDGSNGLGWI